MTSYHGGKQKIGKEIADVIVDLIDLISTKNMRQVKGYCEPFCGMLGVYRHVYESLKQKNIRNVDDINFLAGDSNKSLIMMWKDTQKGWNPPTKCSEQKYNRLKNSKKSSSEKGFIGHQYSYGGQYFKGYRGKYKNKDHYEKASKNVSDIGKSLKDVKFKHGDYTQFNKLKGYIIYCDPPYKGESYYFDEEGNRLSFSHQDFWDWCEKMSKNNIVLISEYNVFDPTKVLTLFQKRVNLTGSSPQNRKRYEKLYLYKN